MRKNKSSMSKGDLLKLAMDSLPLQAGTSSWNFSGDLKRPERCSLVVRVLSVGTNLTLLELPYLGGRRRMVGTAKRHDR